MAMRTCKTVAWGKVGEIVKSTLCSSFLLEVSQGPPLLASSELLAQVSPNLEDELHRQSPVKPSPHRPGPSGRGGGGQGQSGVSSLELGKGRAIAIQAPK